jgi:hypothetical protein
MPVVIACSACQGKMSIPEGFAGKAVRCPKCGQAVRTPGGDGAAAAPAPPPAAKVQPAPKPAPAPAATAAPAAPPIQVTCGGCQKKLQVKAALAGKAVKCPGCGKPVKIPVPSVPAGEGEEWLEVNEAAAPPPAEAPAAQPRRGGPVGEWGKELLDEQGLPEKMQDEIRAEMTKSERIVWAARPRVDILLHRARLITYIAVPICSVVTLTALVVTIICVINGAWLGLIGLLFAGAFGFGGFYTFRMPGQIKKNADRRSCYAITNRRLLIHQGEVAHVYVGRHGAQAAGSVGDASKVTPYTGLELTRIMRVEAGSRFPGAGDIWMGRTLLEEYSGWGLQALDGVRDVEKTLRERLIHPIIDKLLRGEPLSKEEKGKGKSKADAEQGDVMAADSNIKDYGGSKRGKPEIDPDDPNLKAAPGADLKTIFAAALKKVPAEVRQGVDAELTEGEKVLWIGRPEAGVKGRGLLGSVLGAAKRYEPDYTHFAITNRRVILFANKQAPLSYYPPALLEAGVEEDNRIPNGGGIVFRKVKKIVTQTDKNGKSTTTTTLHYFGLLRIRNYKAVAAFLHDTLIAPCRGL